MKKNSLSGVLFGLCCLIVICTVGVAVLHASDFLYRYEMKALGLSFQTGLSEEILLRNYHAVTAYLAPFHNRPFSLPDFSFSPQGAYHFEECRVLFSNVYLAGSCCLLLVVVMLFRLHGKTGRRFWFGAAAAVGVLPLVILCAITAAPTETFNLFHFLFFRNDYWIFDPGADPVIQIFPMEFFLHCGVFLVLCWILCALAFFLTGLCKKRRENPGDVPFPHRNPCALCSSSFRRPAAETDRFIDIIRQKNEK